MLKVRCPILIGILLILINIVVIYYGTFTKWIKPKSSWTYKTVNSLVSTSYYAKPSTRHWFLPTPCCAQNVPNCNHFQLNPAMSVAGYGTVWNHTFHNCDANILLLLLLLLLLLFELFDCYISTITHVHSNRDYGGVRIYYGDPESTTFSQRWNPWSRAMPYVTLTHHLLAYNKHENETVTYNADDMAESLVAAVDGARRHFVGDSRDIDRVTVEDSPIVIDSYGSLISVIHNQSKLGFYLERGGVSFW